MLLNKLQELYPYTLAGPNGPSAELIARNWSSRADYSHVITMLIELCYMLATLEFTQESASTCLISKLARRALVLVL